MKKILLAAVVTISTGLLGITTASADNDDEFVKFDKPECGLACNHYNNRGKQGSWHGDHDGGRYDGMMARKGQRGNSRHCNTGRFQHGKHDRPHGDRQHRHDTGRTGKGRGMMRNLLKGVNLSNVQKEQLKSIFDEVIKPGSAELRSKQRTLSDKKRDLVQSKTFDKAAFEVLMTAQDALRKERRLQQAEWRNKVWNVLTPEQQKAAKERANDYRELMEKQREFHQKWQKNKAE